MIGPLWDCLQGALQTREELGAEVELAVSFSQTLKPPIGNRPGQEQVARKGIKSDKLSLACNWNLKEKDGKMKPSWGEEQTLR